MFAFLFNLEVVSVCLSPTKNLIANQVTTSSISNLTSNLSWLLSYTLFLLSLPCLSAALSEFKTLLGCPMWTSALCLICIPRVGPRRLCFVHPGGAVCQRAHHGANCPAICAPRPLQQGKAVSLLLPRVYMPHLVFLGSSYSTTSPVQFILISGYSDSFKKN